MSRLVFACLIALACRPLVSAAQGVRDATLPEIGYFQTLPSVSASFPKGIDGRPDWVQTLQQGLIEPRSTKSGAPREPEGGVPMPQDGIVFKNTQFMPYVVFPHRQHAEWLSCMNCHESLFELKATGRGKGMNAIFRGEHCGFCHGRVAFSPEGSCYRCHSQPNPAAMLNTPFKAPAAVESAAPAVPAEEAPRGRRGKPVFQAGRLAPSVVPPPAPPPAAPAVAPVLQ